jgi:hypothetical protein
MDNETLMMNTSRLANASKEEEAGTRSSGERLGEKEERNRPVPPNAGQVNGAERTAR